MTAPSNEPKLVRLCRPLFDFVCEARLQLDRGEGGYASATPEALLARVEDEIDSIRTRRDALPEVRGLLGEHDRLLGDLRTFAISVLASGLSDVSRSINLVRQRRDPLEDAAFMENLRDELAQRKPRSVERLVVYAVCLGLGYTGEEEDARVIKRLRTEVWKQVQALVKAPRRSHARAPQCSPLFHEAYDIRAEKLDRQSVPWWTVYVACTVALAAIAIAVVQVRGVGRGVQTAIEAIENAPSAEGD